MSNGARASFVIATITAFACTPFGASDVDAGAGVDSGSGADSGASVDSHPPVPSGRWCANVAPGARCFDFDDPADGFDGGVLTFHEDNGGALRIDDRAASSEPNALLVQVPARRDAGAPKPRAMIRLALDPPFAGLTLAFDMWLEQIGSSDAACSGSCAGALAGISRGSFSTQLYSEKGRAVLQHYDNAAAKVVVNQPLAQKLEMGRWLRVELDVDFAAASASISVDGAVSRIDGLPAFDQAASALVTVGIAQVNTSVESWRVRYDNVVIEQR